MPLASVLLILLAVALASWFLYRQGAATQEEVRAMRHALAVRPVIQPSPAPPEPGKPAKVPRLVRVTFWRGDAQVGAADVPASRRTRVLSWDGAEYVQAGGDEAQGFVYRAEA